MLVKKPTFRRGRSDEDVSRRRKLLLERLLTAGAPGPRSQTADAIRKGRNFFFVACRSNRCTTKYEWWPVTKVTKEGLIEIKAPAANFFDEKWLHTVTELLKQYKVDANNMGGGQPLQRLADEVSRGSARLMLDATKRKTLVRTINAVFVCVRSPDAEDGNDVVHADRRVLIQKVEKILDGQKQKINSLPGIITEAHENSEGAAWRVCRELLGFAEGTLSLSTAANVQNRLEGEVPEESPFAFPGISTVCTSTIVEFVITATDEKMHALLGLKTTNPWTFKGVDGDDRELHWVSASEEVTTHLGMDLAATEGLDTRMVPAAFGPSLQELKAYCNSRKIDVTTANHKSVEDLYAEIRKGDSSLVVYPNGDIMHLVDVVLLQLIDKKGRLLVECDQTIDGTKTRQPRLPTTKRRADENHFCTIWRLIGEQLMLDGNMVRLDAYDVKRFEQVSDSLRLPGLQTISRTRVIKGKIIDSLSTPIITPVSSTPSKPATDS